MKQPEKQIHFRIPASLRQQMIADLKRKHEFAYERVGLLYTRSVQAGPDMTLIVAFDYVPVDDGDYIEDHSVGAKIGSDAIRKGMQYIYENKCGCFHVHLHDGNGRPSPSYTDQKELPAVANSFANISGNQMNGILILSENSFFAIASQDKTGHLHEVTQVSVVGYPMQFVCSDKRATQKNKIFSRQSFLGAGSEKLFSSVRVGIIGYGGGGSHIGQQLAHIGVHNVVVFDNDHIEDTNHNRLIGGWHSDISNRTAKTTIAKRTIQKILPKATLITVDKHWQDAPEFLHRCDIVFGCVDSYSERQQLEAECRRYLIPLIDIGMDVHQPPGAGYSMSGQVILSMPGHSCMTCYGFLTEEKLAAEAANYGNVGGRSQVVWPNGVLASTAVGIFVDLVTGWTSQRNKQVYLAYNGNDGTLQHHIRIKYCEPLCAHYPLSETGPVVFKKLF
jgi:hypothetical protein